MTERVHKILSGLLHALYFWRKGFKMFAISKFILVSSLMFDPQWMRGGGVNIETVSVYYVSRLATNIFAKCWNVFSKMRLIKDGIWFIL